MGGGRVQREIVPNSSYYLHYIINPAKASIYIAYVCTLSSALPCRSHVIVMILFDWNRQSCFDSIPRSCLLPWSCCGIQFRARSGWETEDTVRPRSISSTVRIPVAPTWRQPCTWSPRCTQQPIDGRKQPNCRDVLVLRWSHMETSAPGDARRTDSRTNFLTSI